MTKTIVACAAVLGALAVPATAAETIRLPGADREPTLAISHEPGPGPSVLYVHGATFPQALSIGYRLAGRSWMDDLRARGFDVWAFDLAGYGDSDRPAAMTGAAPVGRMAEAVSQIARVTRYIRATSKKDRVSILAHSWGTLPAGAFAAEHPDRIERLVLFGPPALRKAAPPAAEPTTGASLVSAEDQWASFQSGVPAGEPSPIDRALFVPWAEAYLASDAASATRSPPAVLVPTGPQADLAEVWSGRFPYDPAKVRASTLVVYGEWDPITRDADAAWLKEALVKAEGGVRVAKLPRGAHRMHLEANRQVLFDAVGAFLTED
ncbi:alpha/beta hydrolase [Phenylobacterium sp. LH3H17]|uniref:alpha/beta hydrolase n=1 Tax=Phenylobacterium sp. LH3H17 TaxID=2903901 RepID=UPI0020C9E3E0|nr:alpha/beta fold hydrolase [Phenylobacterium sp. LH3H17]UTP38927.1 alpha/beta hydrolase [Phenylobacterium sp. LH3H17]